MEEMDYHIDPGDVKFAVRKTPKARKDHECDWCPEPIKKGEKYIYTSMMFQGEFTIEKRHPECDEVMNKNFNDLNKSGGIPRSNSASCSSSNSSRSR